MAEGREGEARDEADADASVVARKMKSLCIGMEASGGRFLGAGNMKTKSFFKRSPSRLVDLAGIALLLCLAV